MVLLLRSFNNLLPNPLWTGSSFTAPPPQANSLPALDHSRYMTTLCGAPSGHVRTRPIHAEITEKRHKPGIRAFSEAGTTLAVIAAQAACCGEA